VTVSRLAVTLLDDFSDPWTTMDCFSLILVEAGASWRPQFDYAKCFRVLGGQPREFVNVRASISIFFLCPAFDLFFFFLLHFLLLCSSFVLCSFSSSSYVSSFFQFCCFFFLASSFAIERSPLLEFLDFLFLHFILPPLFSFVCAVLPRQFFFFFFSYLHLLSFSVWFSSCYSSSLTFSSIIVFLVFISSILPFFWILR
jgi:hypothetical protein